jgi:hypothetical protein
LSETWYNADPAGPLTRLSPMRGEPEEGAEGFDHTPKTNKSQFL